MPVRRSGDMNNIHFRKRDQFSVIGKGLDAFIQHAQCLFDVSFIHIADGHHPRTRIFKMSASHAPHTDHSFGKLVAGCKKTFPEYMRSEEHTSELQSLMRLS